jgi:hypothetical protein
VTASTSAVDLALLAICPTDPAITHASPCSHDLESGCRNHSSVDSRLPTRVNPHPTCRSSHSLVTLTLETDGFGPIEPYWAIKCSREESSGSGMHSDPIFALQVVLSEMHNYAQPLHYYTLHYATEDGAEIEQLIAPDCT